MAPDWNSRPQIAKIFRDPFDRANCAKSFVAREGGATKLLAQFVAQPAWVLT